MNGERFLLLHGWASPHRCVRARAAFGGSTVLLLFPPNSIEFDKDLVVNSANALETLVKVGTSIGRATK